MEKQAQEQKQKLNLVFDSKTTDISRIHALLNFRSLKVWAASGVLLFAVGGIALTLFKGSPEPEVYAPTPGAELDKSSIVSASQDSHTDTVFQSTAQLDAFEQQLLSQEAHRYLLEAQKQVTDPNAPCYAQSVQCTLNQFQGDAIAQIERSRNSRDWQTMLAALDRVAAIELARTSVMPSEPEVNLSQLAIDNLVQSHQRQHGASAEAKAWEVGGRD